MKIIGFNHFQLDSKDVEKTRAFYEALGGTVAQVMERDGGWRGYHVRLAENAVIEIQPPRLPEECGGTDGWDHLALLADDAGKVCELIQKAGGRIEKHPTPNKLCGVPIVNAVAYGIDGEKIEIIQELQEEERGTRPGMLKDAIIYGVCHVQLNSQDVERSCKFYQEAFGGKIISRIMEKEKPDQLKGYMVEVAEGSVLEIQPPRFGKSEKKSAWNTIAVETDDIEAACQKIEQAGGVREVGPMRGKMGTIAIWNAVVIGPDGEHVELIQMRQETE